MEYEFNELPEITTGDAIDLERAVNNIVAARRTIARVGSNATLRASLRYHERQRTSILARYSSTDRWA